MNSASSSEIASPSGSPWSAPDSPSGDLPSSPPPRSDPHRDATAAPNVPLRGSPVARLGPRTVGQLLDAGFDVVRFRFARIATLAAVILLPFVAIPAVAAYLAGYATPGLGSVFTEPAPVEAGGSAEFFGATILIYAGSFLAMAAEMMMGLAVAFLVASWLRGSDPTTREVLTMTRAGAITALGAFVLAFIVKFVAAIPCGLGLFYVVPVLSLLAPIVAMEGEGAAASVTRSFRLGGRRWGPLLAITGLWVLVGACVSGALQAALATIRLFLPETSAVGVVTLGVEILASTFVTVISVSVSVLAYLDARVRTEGFDLALEVPRLFPAQES